ATISDASGMVLEVVFDLEDPPSIRFTNVEIQSVSCPGVADASISVKATGGSGALSWLWSNNSNSAALDGLKAGVYSLSVADERGCQLDTLFMIEEPDRIKAVFEVTSGGCSSGAGGSIMVSGTGGMPAYQYKWSTGQLGDHIENLLPGLYTVTITDQANCSVSEQVLLDSVPKLDFVGIVKNTNCAGGTDGQIEIQPVGDTTGLTYNWTNGRKTRRISGLHAGTYGVKVTNSIGCSSEAEFEVSSPAALLVNLRTSAAGCIAGKGGSALALVEGGTMPYQYQWSTGARDSIIEDVDAGTYQLEVMDSLGCQVEQEVIVQSSKSSIAPRFLAASPVSAGQQVQFLDVSSPKPDAWLWDFGVDENSTSVMEDPVYSFPAVQGSSSTRYLTTLKISSDQCIGTSAKWIRVISNDLIPDVGVSEDEILLTNIQKWVVYPNPASSFAKVDIVLSKISEVNLRLISLEGKILQQYKLDNNSVYQKELQLGTIPVGTYLLHLQAGKDVKTAKIIIIK
ncbi:MAG: T9SS type A sorting domain-containing protein, partial [Saprospiraceae bacterium]|nr:T9SS type A sorting domain-containing protein [Saprospiraceae bacterium]